MHEHVGHLGGPVKLYSNTEVKSHISCCLASISPDFFQWLFICMYVCRQVIKHISILADVFSCERRWGNWGSGIRIVGVFRVKSFHRSKSVVDRRDNWGCAVPVLFMWSIEQQEVRFPLDQRNEGKEIQFSFYDLLLCSTVTLRKTISTLYSNKSSDHDPRLFEYFLFFSPPVHNTFLLEKYMCIL